MAKFSKKFSREYNTKNLRKKIYIFTEGEKTEPEYFQSIKSENKCRNIEIKIIGKGFNTLSLIDYIINYKNSLNDKFLPRQDKIWAVFDKDSFVENFDIAIKKAQDNEIEVAYSNECFELWYLLHFDLHVCDIGRDAYIKKLHKKLAILTKNNVKKYKKNSPNMYNLIKHLEPTAIKNSKHLLSIHKDEKSYFKKTPSTTVFLLVEYLHTLFDYK